MDREGQEEAIGAPAREYAYARLSPDGTRIALDCQDEERDIWIWDLVRETMTRLTFDEADDNYPLWTPDGERVAFSSNRGGEQGVYWKKADGTGEVEHIGSAQNRIIFPF